MAENRTLSTRRIDSTAGDRSGTGSVAPLRPIRSRFRTRPPLSSPLLSSLSSLSMLSSRFGRLHGRQDVAQDHDSLNVRSDSRVESAFALESDVRSPFFGGSASPVRPLSRPTSIAKVTVRIFALGIHTKGAKSAPLNETESITD